MKILVLLLAIEAEAKVALRLKLERRLLVEISGIRWSGCSFSSSLLHRLP